MFDFRPVLGRLFQHFGALRHFAGQKWRVAITLADGFRIAWVSTLSVVAALVVLVYLPQGKDLFLDVRGSRSIGILFWFGFYIAVLLIWLLPVYVSSCWILKCYPAGGPHGNPALAYWVRDTVPRVLVLLGLIAILGGQVGAVAEAPYIATGIDGRDQKKLILYVLSFISGVFLLVVFREWLFERFSSFGDMRAWRINVRGMLATLAMFVAVMFVGAELKDFAESPGAIIRDVIEKHFPFFDDLVNEGSLAAFIFLSLVAVPLGYVLSFVRYRLVKWLSVALLFLSSLLFVVPLTLFIAWLVAQDLSTRIWALWTSEAAAPLGIGHLVLLPPITLFLAHMVWMFLKPARDVPLQALASGRRGKPVAALQAIRQNLDGHFASLLLISIGIICVHVCLSPVLVTGHIYRALLLPFLLGLLIPVLTFISFWSFRWHAPFVLAAVIVLALIAPDSDDIRTVKNDARRPTLEESVRRWESVNECDVPATDPARKCPSPIIISAAGGASRSAFLVGSVIGKLLDEKTSSSGEALRPFDQQLFAISGVSGGALGAVVTYAALADSVRAKGASRQLGHPPCKKEAHDSEWFARSTRTAANPASPETSWHDCLQLILSGDFLSPVMASLISGELAGYTPYGDRSAVLEAAWEQRYADLTGQNRSSGDNTPTTMASSLTGLRERGLAASPKAWLPMLLLTGTSVTTGRRILTSDVDTLLSAKLNNLRGRLFRDAYDLHELISPHLTINEASFSPDGKELLIVYDNNNKVEILDVATGTTRKLLDTGPDPAQGAQWSPDGQYIVSWSYGDTVKLWRAATGEVTKTFDKILTQTGSPIFANDNQTLMLEQATSQGDATVRHLTIWDLSTGSERWQIDIENSIAAAFVQDGHSVAITYEGKAVLLDVLTGTQKLQFDGDSVNISKDGQAAVTCQKDQPAKVYSTSTGQLLTQIDELNCFGNIQLSRDGKYIAIDRSSGGGHAALVFEIATGKKLLDTGYDNRTVALNEAVDKLVFAPKREAIKIFDFRTGETIRVAGTSGDTAANFRFSPNGRAVLMWQKSWAGRGGARVIDLANGGILREFRGQEGWVDGAIFNSDTSLVFAWSDNGLGRLWNFEKGEELFVMRGAISSAVCLSCDIRLSTAATMSARFPIISPHGTLRNGGTLVDRIVDGGYFENFGALTASELAEELHSQFGLEPRIILINNEPSAAGMSCLDQDSQLDMPQPEQRIYFSTFHSPINAMWATRTARGTLAAVELCAHAEGRANFAFITVKQDGRFAGAELPMSWWLSKHAQQYLDAQIETSASDSNDRAFENIKLWRQYPATP